MLVRVVATVACVLLTGCATPLPDVETTFRQEQPALTRVVFDWDLPTCGGAAGTAYMRGDQVVGIQAVICTSNRRIERDCYFTGQDLVLLVQRTLVFRDDQGEMLYPPKPETQTRFEFRHGRLTRTTGDPPPYGCGPDNAQDEAAELLARIASMPGLTAVLAEQLVRAIPEVRAWVIAVKSGGNRPGFRVTPPEPLTPDGPPYWTVECYEIQSDHSPRFETFKVGPDGHILVQNFMDYCKPLMTLDEWRACLAQLQAGTVPAEQQAP
jgi:hypothetical protein